MLWGDWRVCTFESPRSSLNKISWTRQFESKLSLRSFAKSLNKRIFSKITPSLFTLKEGSTSHPDPLSSGAREKTALLGARNRYALRLADHQRSSPDCAGWDRQAVAGGDLMLHQSPRHGCAGWDRLAKGG